MPELEDREPTPKSPRAVSALLSSALTRLGVIQPPSLRGPIADSLREGIERCVMAGPSLLGLPIENTIRLAQALVNAEVPEKAGINITSAETPEETPLKTFVGLPSGAPWSGPAEKRRFFEQMYGRPATDEDLMKLSPTGRIDVQSPPPHARDQERPV